MALQPGVASADVAARLAEAGAAGELPAGGQLADDTRARLGAHEDRCRELLQHGQVLVLSLADCCYQIFRGSIVLFLLV